MARIRSLKPEFCTSEAIVALSIPCRLHFSMLWTYADDEGRGVDNPKLIKAALWPLDDDVDADRVEAWQAELEQGGRLRRYVVDGKRYFEVTNWSEHQKPNHKVESRNPPPPEVNGQGDRSEGSGSPQVALSPVVVGGEGDGEGGASSARPSDSRRKPKRPIAAPFVLSDEQIEWVRHELPNLDYDSATDEWALSMKAKDFRYSDWDAAWKNGMKKAARWHKPETARTHL